MGKIKISRAKEKLRSKAFEAILSDSSDEDTSPASAIPGAPGSDELPKAVLNISLDSNNDLMSPQSNNLKTSKNADALSDLIGGIDINTLESMQINDSEALQQLVNPNLNLGSSMAKGNSDVDVSDFVTSIVKKTIHSNVDINKNKNSPFGDREVRRSSIKLN